VSSRLLALLNEVTTSNVHSFLLFGRVTIVSIIILSSIFIAALPIILLLLPNQSAFATFPGENDTKIAFTSTRDGNNEIYVMNAADGSNQTRLTNNTDIDEFPAWSPDSTKIAFTSNLDIYVMNAVDGSDQTRLTNNATLDTHPSWSPDGTKIAFTSSTRDVNNEIYVMNAADGSNPTRLTNNTDIDEFPAWSTAATEPE
jgi:Tol biopolymer transport system component